MIGAATAKVNVIAPHFGEGMAHCNFLGVGSNNV